MAEVITAVKEKTVSAKRKGKEMSDIDIEKCRLSMQILDLLPTPVMSVDKEFNVTFMNPAGAQAVGKTPEACVGQKCFSLFNTEQCNTPDCQVAKAMQENRVCTNDTTAKLTSGELPIRCSGAPLKDSDGNIVGGLEYVLDISKEMEVADGVRNLVDATVEGKLDTRADADKFEGNYQRIIQGVNQLIDAFSAPFNVSAEYVDRISKGDIPEPITDEYKGDFNEIKNNLNQLIDVSTGLLEETGNLIQATNDGKLDTRGEAEKFAGGWGNLVGGVNQLIDAFSAPFNVSAEYVDRISKGDIPEPITDEYKGDFNEIKNNLNQLIDVSNGLLEETGNLIQATKDGKLDTRGEAEKFAGGWGNLVGGVNQLIDAFIGPINITAEYVDRISKGDIPEKITDDYKGDFNEIKNNLNQCIDVLKALIEEDGGVALEASANKNLTVRLKREYNGAYAKMKDNINEMLDSMSNALGQAGIASEQVGTASGQVSSSSQALAEGSSEQAASLEETASSLEEMASMVNQNSANANQANTLMKEANQVVDKAKGSMAEVNKAMGDISHASQETQKIIKTIDEIAFQTNLLALNAAVEAARAGEAGAGFAVVADEVRNLAMRAADAAKNTADLIEGTVKKVDNGAGLVKTTDEAFEEVATAAAKVGELVSEISAASDEQSKGIEEVNKAVAEMDKVTQQNAATAEETASASEELSAQANELDSMLAEFELGKQGGNGGKSGRMAAPKQPAGNIARAQQPGKKHPAAKVVNPEVVIPMDSDEVSDGGFKDF